MRGHGSADAGSVDSRLRIRNWHLHTSHYLHARKHSEVRFRADHAKLAVRQADARLEVRDRAVSFPVTIDEIGASGGELHVKVSGRFDRRGLGMLAPPAGVSRLIHRAAPGAPVRPSGVDRDDPTERPKGAAADAVGAMARSRRGARGRSPC